MDVTSFYSCKRKQNEEKRSATQRHSVKLTHLKRHLDPDIVWRVFPRQQMAFDFAKTCWQSAVVFAFESEEFGNQGQRKYLVTTYYHFSMKYLAMKPPRHFYEVISEGAVCRLYFDIEFNLDLNPHTPPIPVLDTFIDYVCYQLNVTFKLRCDRGHVVDLDSSSKQKFSRHLIFHLPNAVFTNNIQAGNWVHHICDQLWSLRSASERGTEPSEAWKTLFAPNTPPCPSAKGLLMLFVSTEKGGMNLICDEGVYTRNRNFRLFLSSKLGKTSHLTLAQENQFKSVCGKNVQRKTQLVNIFMDTLICNVSSEKMPRILSFESPTRSQRKPPSAVATAATSSCEGYSSSPYPLVDRFITGCVNKGGVQGDIRRWSYFQQEKLVVYDIKHNRWCENIQRAHKSNNIMIIADMQRGVYYQKCHDPVCRGINFKSYEYLIPRDINPLVQHNQSISSSQADVSTSGDSGSEWLMDLSLEDLQDYSLEDVGGEYIGGGDCGGCDSCGGGDGGGCDSCGGGDGGNWDSGGGNGLDDESILDRVANEMDLNISDTTSNTRSCDASAYGATPASTLSSTHSECNNDTDMDTNSHYEDSLFDRAYDLYESKIT